MRDISNNRPYYTTACARLLIVAAAAGLFFASCTPEERSSGRPAEHAIVIQNAWARTASRGMTGGAYLTVYNGTSQADTLTGVSTDAAGSAEIHESFRQENGMSGMRPAGDLPVEAGSGLELMPGGYHVMLMQLKRDLAPGDSISLTFHFSRYDSIATRVPVVQKQ